MPDLLEDLFRGVNDRIRSLDAGSDLHYFFCECADPHCFRPVALGADRYDDTRRTGAPLYAPDCPLRPVAAEEAVA
jgi:hypothetical protein